MKKLLFSALVNLFECVSSDISNFSHVTCWTKSTEKSSKLHENIAMCIHNWVNCKVEKWDILRESTTSLTPSAYAETARNEDDVGVLKAQPCRKWWASYEIISMYFFIIHKNCSHIFFSSCAWSVGSFGNLCSFNIFFAAAVYFFHFLRYFSSMLVWVVSSLRFVQLNNSMKWKKNWLMPFVHSTRASLVYGKIFCDDSSSIWAFGALTSWVLSSWKK